MTGEAGEAFSSTVMSRMWCESIFDRNQTADRLHADKLRADSADWCGLCVKGFVRNFNPKNVFGGMGP